MRQAEFERWLMEVYLTKRDTRLAPTSRATTVADCRRVRRFKGDLDQHAAKDDMASLIQLFTFSTADHRAGRPPAHDIPMGGNAYNQTASLRRALRLYQTFYRAWPVGGKQPPETKASEVHAVGRPSTSANWPTWAVPGEDELLQQARMITKYVRYLSPEVVAAIAEDNDLNAQAWSEALRERGVDASCWLWPGSTCAFPGVRRYSGSKEISGFRATGTDRCTTAMDALAIDDNSYPKHIWSQVLRGRPFENVGPTDYALAHLLDHKAHGGRLQRELSMSGDAHAKTGLPGLFTSAANTVYVPTGFLRPTDFEGRLRSLLQRRAIEMHKDTCSPLPPGITVTETEDPTWRTDAFEWADPVGSLDGAERFLRYRAQRMQALFAAKAPTHSSTDSAESFEARGPDGSSQRLDLWCGERLSLQKMGTHEDVRIAIRSRLSQLRPAAGTILHAIYESAVPLQGADVENIVLYNVRAPVFHEVTREGLLLERVDHKPTAAPSGRTWAHHHVYELTPTDCEPEHWRFGETISEWRDVRVQGVPTDHPALVWAAMRKHGYMADRDEGTVPARYGLRLDIRCRPGHSAAKLVKIVSDGVISAMHVHDGTDIDTLTDRVALRVPATAQEVRAWLCSPATAPLGRRALVHLRADGIQWNPADDACVVLCLRVHEDPSTDEGLVLAGSIHEVRAQ